MIQEPGQDRELDQPRVSDWLESDMSNIRRLSALKDLEAGFFPIWQMRVDCMRGNE